VYCVGMIEDIAVVTGQDVRELLAPLKPGSVHSAAALYARYMRNLKGTGRMAPHPTALGHALREAGCERKRVRRSRGGRKNRDVSEVACWVIPGESPDLPDPVTELVRTMGSGIHLPDEIARQYRLMYWNNGWGDPPLSRFKLLAHLTNLGYPPIRHEGQPARDFRPPS
jgi:hypothetical protein